MKTRKFILAAILIGFFTFKGEAQDNGNIPDLAINTSTYKTAIGLRGGETSGLTIKQFIGSSTAIEGIIGMWYHGLSTTILYERHAPGFGVDGLNWYYGVGGHLAFQTGYYAYYYRNDRYRYYSNGNLGLGIDGVIGLEYKIPKAPFAISLDMKPYVEVASKGNVWMSLDPGLGIKVTF